ncbi:MAG: AAA family ATPase [Clostridia bacterium]|nr:AAA family ATPase [Clostridia bacterium]
MPKITSLEIENVKRVRAIALTPAESGLTVIGGRNGQGKTSVLDAIAWALGGDRFKPSQPQRDGSVIPPHLKIVLDNGLIVERSGKNSALKVIDPSGNKAGQQLLNEFVEQFALDLPRFMQQSSKDKARTLLKIIGVGEQLYALEHQEQTLYNQRHAIGQIADQKKKYAAELPSFDGIPTEPVSASVLIRRQQEILARNGENQRKRQQLDSMLIRQDAIVRDIDAMYAKIRELEEQRDNLFADIAIAQKDTAQLRDESTAELEQSIRDIEQLNIKIRANLDKERAEDEAREYRSKYDELTVTLEALRANRLSLLSGADLPLPGLSVDEQHELIYNGKPWDCMSGADQLKVACAIVRRINPRCEFVLMDKLEQMDTATLAEFSAWLESEGLQVIATRVSTGDECSVIIEDGYVVSNVPAVPDVPTENKTGGYWT